MVPTLGPDATGVGHVFWYTVEGNGYSFRDLRSLQDWYARYQLDSVPGVAEVASVGGMVRQYQVDVDPNRLRAYRIPLCGDRRRHAEQSQRGRERRGGERDMVGVVGLASGSRRAWNQRCFNTIPIAAYVSAGLRRPERSSREHSQPEETQH